MHQIATDQGLLAAPVEVSRIRLAPAERVDLVIDFAGHRGRQLVVENDGEPILQFRVGGRPRQRHQRAARRAPGD